MTDRSELRWALCHLVYCYGLAPDAAGVQAMLGLIDELHERIEDEDARELRRYLAELGARAAIEDANGQGGASDSPRADRAQDAQEAPGAAQARAPVSEPSELPVSLPLTSSGIDTGILAEVRAALGAAPLSLRVLRRRVGRGWEPVRAAVEGLVAAGEIARDGRLGRHVRFRLVGPRAAPLGGTGAGQVGSDHMTARTS